MLKVYVSVYFVKPPKPNPPAEETDEEKGLRRLFEQIAGSVRNNCGSLFSFRYRIILIINK